MNTQKITAIVILFIATVCILIYGQSLIVPMVLAFMMWFFIKAIREKISAITPTKWTMPTWLQNSIAFVILSLVLVGLGKILSSNIQHMSEVLPQYEKNIQNITQQLNNTFNIDLVSTFKEYAQDFNITSILKNILNSISDLLANAFLIILYVMFLLIEERYFPIKLRKLFKDESQLEKTKSLLKNIDKSINEYILLKSLMSFTTGTLSYFVLLLIGVDFAFFWAFLIFLLNYIPTIGSLIATIFPAAIVLLQTATLLPFFLVLGSIGAIQVIVGNIIEPKFMGNSLNVSSLVVMVALSFWGTLWGIVGMMISVPVTVVMILILAQFPKTKGIAVLLSGDGKLVKE